MIDQELRNALEQSPWKVFGALIEQHNTVMQLREDITKYRELAEHKTQIISQDCGFGHYPSSKVEACAIAITDITKQYDKEKTDLDKKKYVLHHVLIHTEPQARYVHIIEDRYFRCMRWSEIANMYGLSKRRLYTIRDNVFQKVGEKACTFTAFCDNI